MSQFKDRLSTDANLISDLCASGSGRLPGGRWCVVWRAKNKRKQTFRMKKFITAIGIAAVSITGVQAQIVTFTINGLSGTTTSVNGSPSSGISTTPVLTRTGLTANSGSNVYAIPPIGLPALRVSGRICRIHGQSQREHGLIRQESDVWRLR